MSTRRSGIIMVGIPAYNEAKSIGSIVKNALSYCNEVIVCDDVGQDLTLLLAKVEQITLTAGQE